MTVHSTQFGANASIGTGGYTLYTVPSGHRALLKSLQLQNTNGSAQRAAIALNLATGDDVVFYVHLAAIGSDGESVNVPWWIVLDAGDVLRVVPAADHVIALASGALFTL